MPHSPSKNSDRITAIVDKETKARLKIFAKAKRWTLSQAAAYFIEIGLDEEERGGDYLVK
ncbi:MAG: eal/GGDEF/PAS domain-containing protein [Okeania sp. SIO2C9]|nr:eal/GGDEF/PAS domain-containing protein [Okeania sp. SIO2C9]